MKRIFTLAIATALLFSATRSFAQTLDSSVPAGEAGKWTLGAGYQYNTVRYRTNASSTSFPINQNRIYLRAMYDLSKNWDIGVHAGLGDASTGTGNAKLLSSYGFTSVTVQSEANNPSYTGYAGLSFHGNFYSGERFSFGIVGQGSIFMNLDASTHVVATAVSSTVTIVSTTDVGSSLQGFRDGQIVLSFSVSAGRSLIYLGPLYYRSAGRYALDIASSADYITSTGTTTLAITLPTIKQHIRQTNSLGGYLGIRMPSHSDWMFNMETAYRGGFNIGASFTRAF